MQNTTFSAEHSVHFHFNENMPNSYAFSFPIIHSQFISKTQTKIWHPASQNNKNYFVQTFPGCHWGRTFLFAIVLVLVVFVVVSPHNIFKATKLFLNCQKLQFHNKTK
jgi:hypothetical protein